MWNYIIVFGLFLWAVIALHVMEKRKKKGKSRTCGGDCANCPVQCRAKFL